MLKSKSYEGPLRPRERLNPIDHLRAVAMEAFNQVLGSILLFPFKSYQHLPHKLGMDMASCIACFHHFGSKFHRPPARRRHGGIQPGTRLAFFPFIFLVSTLSTRTTQAGYGHLQLFFLSVFSFFFFGSTQLTICALSPWNLRAVAMEAFN